MKAIYLLTNILISAAILNSVNSFAQPHVVPPGPSSETKVNCKDLMDNIITNEKLFVENEKNKYLTHKDFFKAIDNRLLIDSVQGVSKDGLTPEITKCSAKDIGTLKDILEDYKVAKKEFCINFRLSGRKEYIDKIDKLISINED